jgi:hypothetical protein
MRACYKLLFITSDFLLKQAQRELFGNVLDRSDRKKFLAKCYLTFLHLTKAPAVLCWRAHKALYPTLTDLLHGYEQLTLMIEGLQKVEESPQSKPFAF